MFPLSALYNIAPLNSRTRGCACDEVAALRSDRSTNSPFLPTEAADETRQACRAFADRGSRQSL